MTTQMYLKGHPLNDGDAILNSVKNPLARNSLMVKFYSAPNFEPGAQAGKFDIILSRNTFKS